MDSASTAGLLARAGATLVLLGLLTGGFAAAAMTGQVPADAHAALAAHLNALLGAFLLFGVAWSLPLVRYGDVGRRRLAWIFIGANYANWAITGVKALLKVSGVGLNGVAANDAVFVALNVAVVVPSLAAAAAWVWGLRK